MAYARGEQSRAIALHGRALKHADAAHDSRAIGLAHYELALCYTKVGDTAIVREHIAEAAAALHAAGDRRHLALVHSLSGMMLAQAGRYDEAATALRLAEQQATALSANDVLAIICINQANVALIRHRYDQALALAERAVTLHEDLGPLAARPSPLATLGQICVRIGNLTRADTVLHRALEARSSVRFHETTGGGLRHARADVGDARRLRERVRISAARGRRLRRLRAADEPLVRVVGPRDQRARLAIRRGAPDAALEIADEIAAPPTRRRPRRSRAS